MRQSRGWVLIALMLPLSALLLKRADARIVVGVSTVNVAFLPIYVTQDKGFFKDEGLDVLVVMFNSGATNLQALIGGDVQIMAGGVPETVLARASGVDIKNFWSISNLMPFQIYGIPNFKTLKEARGKKFAISRFGSLSEFLTRSSLRQFGVDAKDVTMLQIGATQWGSTSSPISRNFTPIGPMSALLRGSHGWVERKNRQRNSCAPISAA